MEMVYLWTLAFIVGLGFLGFALTKKQPLGPMQPAVTIAIGGGLAVFGLIWGVLPLTGYESDGTGTVTIVEETISGTAFDITPANGTQNVWTDTGYNPVTIAADEESVTSTITATPEEAFIQNITCVNFTIKPVPPVGADSQDLATIYFSVDELQKYGGNYIFQESSNVYRAKWVINSGTTQENYEGSHTMLMTDEDWVLLTMELSGADTDSDVSQELDAVGETMVVNVNFWNSDRSWTQTIPITFVVISITGS
jgi:hypothetical protein